MARVWKICPACKCITDQLRSRFCAEHAIKTDARNPFRPLPHLKLVHAYIVWLSRRMHGYFERKVTVQTMMTHWTYFRTMTKDIEGTGYSAAQVRQVNQVSESSCSNALLPVDRFKWIKSGLKHHEKLSTKARPKSLADHGVARDILHFLWACDEHEMAHPRMRLQMSFAILLLFYTGARPGEIIESTQHKKSNEGLQYQDIKIMRVVLPDRAMRSSVRRAGRRSP